MQAIFHALNLDLSFKYLMLPQREHVWYIVWFWILHCILLVGIFCLYFKPLWNLVLYTLVHGYDLISLSSFDFYTFMAFYNLFAKQYALFFIGSEEQSFSPCNMDFKWNHCSVCRVLEKMLLIFVMSLVFGKKTLLLLAYKFLTWCWVYSVVLRFFWSPF